MANKLNYVFKLSSVLLYLHVARNISWQRFMATSLRFHPHPHNKDGHHVHIFGNQVVHFSLIGLHHHEKRDAIILEKKQTIQHPWLNALVRKLLHHSTLADANMVHIRAPRYHLPQQAVEMSTVESLAPGTTGTVTDDPIARQKVWEILRKQEEEEKKKETQGSGLVSAGHWVWYLGHLYVVFAALPSLFACITYHGSYGKGGLIYKSFFSATCITYTLSLVHALDGETPGFYSLLPLRTFQYGFLSFLWIWTWPHAIKILPFALYSLLHVSEFAKNYLSRTGKHTGTIFHGLADHFGPQAAQVIAYLDMVMLLQLIWDFILIRRGAVVSLIVFGFFYRIQLMYSAISYNAFKDVYSRVDAQLSKPSMPKSIQQSWIRLRNRIEESRARNSQLYAKDVSEAIEQENLEASEHANES